MSNRRHLPQPVTVRVCPLFISCYWDLLHHPHISSLLTISPIIISPSWDHLGLLLINNRFWVALVGFVLELTVTAFSLSLPPSYGLTLQLQLEVFSCFLRHLLPRHLSVLKITTNLVGFIMEYHSITCQHKPQAPFYFPHHVSVYISSRSLLLYDQQRTYGQSLSNSWRHVTVQCRTGRTLSLYLQNSDTHPGTLTGTHQDYMDSHCRHLYGGTHGTCKF